MNIWIINQFAGTPVNGWGERHFFLSKTWLENGHDVSIISGAYNHVFSVLPEVSGQFTIELNEGRKFCWIKTPRYHGQSKWRFWSMFVFTIKSMFVPISKLGKPDVIIVSSMPIFPVISALYYRIRYGTRFIFEIRDLWPLSLIHLMGVSESNPAVKLIGWFERLGYRKADAIVSVLPSSDKYINAISGDPSKFNWIPNGLGEDSMNNEQPSAEIMNLIPANKFIIGYTGTFGKANALNYLIDAAALLTHEENIHFVLVGDGYLKDELANMATHLSNVTFIPKVKKNQVKAIIEKFDICYIGWCNSPLYYHGVSANKYSDYMLCSKPILDSNNLIKDPVEQSGCGLIVQPESVEAIATGVMELFNLSSEKLNEMGSLGYKYVKTNNDMKLLALKYEKLFQ